MPGPASGRHDSTVGGVHAPGYARHSAVRLSLGGSVAPRSRPGPRPDRRRHARSRARNCCRCRRRGVGPHRAGPCPPPAPRAGVRARRARAQAAVAGRACRGRVLRRRRADGGAGGSTRARCSRTRGARAPEPRRPALAIGAGRPLDDGPDVTRWAYLRRPAFARAAPGRGHRIVGRPRLRTPEGTVTALSHGCIRLRNPAMLRFARLLPVGTPVEIR